MLSHQFPSKTIIAAVARYIEKPSCPPGKTPPRPHPRDPHRPHGLPSLNQLPDTSRISRRQCTSHHRRQQKETRRSRLYNLHPIGQVAASQLTGMFPRTQMSKKTTMKGLETGAASRPRLLPLPTVSSSTASSTGGHSRARKRQSTGVPTMTGKRLGWISPITT